MSSNQKVYVIDSVDKSDPKGKSSVLYAPNETAGRGRAARGRASKPAGSSSEDVDRIEERGSPTLALLAYLAGPLAIFATRRGRSSGFWRATAIVSCCGAALFALRAGGVIPVSRAFGTGSLLWLAGACVATALGFSAWARGVYLAGRVKAPLLRRVPAVFRHPAAAGALGLVVPGLGLYAAGHPRRAACAIWAVSLLAIPVAILSSAPGLWAYGMNGGLLSLPQDDLEIALIAIVAVGLIGALAWIVQALDGMRLAGLRPDGEPHARGDLAALALVVAVAAFVGLFQPAEIARDLDRFAVAMRWEGMRLVPLCAATCAMRLDPSRPEYTLHVIAMNESLDRLGEAEALRDDLAQRWDAYARAFPAIP